MRNEKNKNNDGIMKRRKKCNRNESRKENEPEVRSIEKK